MSTEVSNQDATALEMARTPAEMRKLIAGLEASMHAEVAAGNMTDVVCDLPMRHHFIPGGYAREMTIPAGTLVVGKIHRYPCFNIVSAGSVTVFTEEGRKRIDAPAFFRSEPGIKRVAYAHADTVWTTMHATTETDVPTLEDQLTCASYEEFNRITQSDNGETQCLSEQ